MTAHLLPISLMGIARAVLDRGGIRAAWAGRPVHPVAGRAVTRGPARAAGAVPQAGFGFYQKGWALSWAAGIGAPRRSGALPGCRGELGYRHGA